VSVVEDSEYEKIEAASAETRHWVEVVKVFASAYLLGFVSCLWLDWHMGLHSRRRCTCIVGRHDGAP
jgi:hypothetical protein